MIDTIAHFMTGYFRYNLHGLLNIAAALLNLSIGIIIFQNNPKSPAHRAFFLMSIVASGWTFGFGMQSLVRNSENAYLWLSFGFLLGIPWISPTVYLFVRLWLRVKGHSWPVFLAFLLGGILAFVMAWQPHALCRYVEYSWGRYPRYQEGPWVNAYLLLLLFTFFTFGLLAFANFFRGWKRANSLREKTQIRNILIAFLLAYIGSVDFFTSATNHPVYPLGYIALTFLVISVAYNIVRLRFMDVNIFLKRASLVFGIYSALLAASFPIVIPLMRKLLHEINSSQILTVMGICVFFGFVLSLGPFIYARLVSHNFWLRTKVSTGLAHELKSPLSSIQSAVDILLEIHESPTPDLSMARDYVGMIKSNSLRLETFVKELLNVARIQEGDIVLHTSRFDLAPMLDDMVSQFRPVLERKGLSIRSETAACEIEADAAKIQEVLSNLLSNAVKFSDHSTISIRLFKREGEVWCSVSDQGRGIPAKDLDRIFERFYQGQHAHKGSGLGLAIAKGWVEAHGGKIWAESEGEEKGCKVTFTLPFIET